MFAGYLVLFAWLVTKVKFFSNSGLTPAQLIIIFLLKVMAGIFYGWTALYYNDKENLTDTWSYHIQSIKEFQLLKQYPSEFIYSLFRPSPIYEFNYFERLQGSYWNTIDNILLNKFIAFFNFLSFGNYFINIIFFSFLTLFGPFAIYKVMKDIYPHRKNILLVFSFFIPSFIYWTSGIHKDGLIFLGIGLVTYQLYFLFKERKASFSRILFLLVGLLLVLGLKYSLAINIVPAIIAWCLAEKLSARFKPVYVFAGAYAVFTIFFFTAQYIHPTLNLPGMVSLKQEEFLMLNGRSAVPIKILEPTFIGFLKNFPQAFSLSFLRPYITDTKDAFTLLAALETFFLLLVCILSLVFKKRTPLSAVILFCLFFSFSVLLTIGYTVHFLGAIVRYRSIVLPLIMAPIAAQVNWRALSKIQTAKASLNHYIRKR